MPKTPLFFTVLIIILGATFIIYSQKPDSNGVYKPGAWQEADTAVNQAKHFFAIRKSTGEDLSSGPCLSNALLNGWVADIVHSPRQAIDDLPQNQCSAILEGKAAHFIELDVNGNIVKVK